MDAVNKYFIDVIKNHYFDFNGRATRQEFWMFMLFSFVAGILVVVVAVVLASIGLESIGMILYIVVCLALILPYYGIGARRLHDTNKSGWLQLINLIPFGAFVLIYFFVVQSDEGDNKYGPPSQG